MRLTSEQIEALGLRKAECVPDYSVVDVKY